MTFGQTQRDCIHMDLFLLLRSGVLKEYSSGGQKSSQRRTRTFSDSSLYDAERKTPNLAVVDVTER